MTNSQEKRISRAAQTKGYRLEKVGKGPHHGRFCIVNVAEGSDCLRHLSRRVFLLAPGS